MSHFREFGLVIAFFVLLFIAWVATGGPEHAKQTGIAGDKFIEPLNPFEPVDTYDEPLWDPSKGAIQNPTLRQ